MPHACLHILIHILYPTSTHPLALSLSLCGTYGLTLIQTDTHTDIRTAIHPDGQLYKQVGKQATELALPECRLCICVLEMGA